MEKILVTGGAGYIGSHCAKTLSKNSFIPVVIDNLSTGHQEFLKFGPSYIGDIMDEELLKKIFSENKISGVIHFAAKSLVGESVQKPDMYFKNNVEGTKTLLEMMKEFDINKIIFSSSAAVYGKPNLDIISEETKPNPINPYGETKLKCEELIEKFILDKGLACKLRYFNVTGSDPEGEIYEKHDPETHLVPNLIKAFIYKSDFQLFGADYETPDGTCIRDYVDVNDLAEIHVMCLQKILKNKRVPPTLNVGIGKGLSVREVLKIVENKFGGKINVSIQPRRLGDPSKLVASNNLLKQLFPKFSFKSLDESCENLFQLVKSKRLSF